MAFSDPMKLTIPTKESVRKSASSSLGSYYDPMAPVPVVKANPYHGAGGKFTTADDAGSASTAKEHDAASAYHAGMSASLKAAGKHDEAMDHADAAGAHGMAAELMRTGDASAKTVSSEARNTSVFLNSVPRSNAPEEHDSAASWHNGRAAMARSSGNEEAAIRHEDAAYLHTKAAVLQRGDSPGPSARQASQVAHRASVFVNVPK